MQRNFTFLKVVFSFLSPFLFSQITYESSDFTTVGETYQLVNTASPTDFNFTETGENFSWNFSGLPLEDAQTTEYENPNNSPFKSIWCLYHFYLFDCDDRFNENFNMGMPLGEELNLGEYSFSNIYQHSQKSNSDFQLKMIAGNVNLGGTELPGILEYQNSDVLFQFPIVYNQTYSDTSSMDMDFNALGVDLIVNATGTRNNQVEGWGSLNVRNKIYANTLKLKSTNVQFFNIYFEGQHNEIPVTMVSYSWFDKDYGIPVLTVNGTEVEGEFIPATVSYIFDESMRTLDASTTKTWVYPNPTTGKIQVNLETNEQIESVQIMDYSGKLVSRNLDLSNLPKGSYVLKIQTNKKVISEKIIRK
jgi:hypothetical protein